MAADGHTRHESFSAFSEKPRDQKNIQTPKTKTPVPEFPPKKPDVKNLKKVKERLEKRKNEQHSPVQEPPRERYVISREKRVPPRKPVKEDFLPSHDPVTGKKKKYSKIEKDFKKKEYKLRRNEWKRNKRSYTRSGGILDPVYQANASVLFGHNPQPLQIRSGGLLNPRSPYQEGKRIKGKKGIRNRGLIGTATNMIMGGLAVAGALASEPRVDTTPHAETTVSKTVANRERERTAERGIILSFEGAYEYARRASAATGVDAAIIMAVMMTESNFGRHMGDAYLTNPETGAGMSKSGTPLQNVMKPSRDVRPFLELMDALGQDPYRTRVSAPIVIRGQPYGYGGGMAYSQTIASEWMRHRVPELRALAEPGGTPRLSEDMQRITGMEFAPLDEDFRRLMLSGRMPDPWDPETAALAVGVAFRDNGCIGPAAGHKLNACFGKYYSGANWQSDSHEYIRTSNNNLAAIRRMITEYEAGQFIDADRLAREATQPYEGESLDILSDAGNEGVDRS